jgi:hypothetical protein
MSLQILMLQISLLIARFNFNGFPPLPRTSADGSGKLNTGGLVHPYYNGQQYENGKGEQSLVVFLPSAPFGVIGGEAGQGFRAFFLILSFEAERM